MTAPLPDPPVPRAPVSSRRGRWRRRYPALAVVLALTVGACADDDVPSASGGDDAGTEAATATGAAGTDEAAEATEGATSDDDDGDGGAAGDEGDDPAGTGFAAIPDIVEEVEPSVVTVVTDTGVGSGVVYDSEGTIVTNNHVVERTTEVVVVFADETRVPARLVATAPLLDLAVLDADRADLPAAEFADELPRVGELAIAIGSPLGLEHTVTAGIVSGLNRGIPGSARTTQSLVNLIQTDAAISPGNSGGALVDGRGRVIGINVAYLPPTAGAVSLGFAIPSTQVRDAVEQLIETGEVSLAYIGIVPAQLTPQIAERFGFDRDRGVLVADTEPGAPAAIAGLEPGDLIVAIEGEDTGSVEDFLGVLRRRRPGETVEVEVVRDGEVRTFDVTLGDRPPS